MLSSHRWTPLNYVFHCGCTSRRLEQFFQSKSLLAKSFAQGPSWVSWIKKKWCNVWIKCSNSRTDLFISVVLMTWLFCCVSTLRAKKIVLQGTNTAHLLELQALAMSLSLPTKLIQDAGLTQVEIISVISENIMQIYENQSNSKTILCCTFCSCSWSKIDGYLYSHWTLY